MAHLIGTARSFAAPGSGAGGPAGSLEVSTGRRTLAFLLLVVVLPVLFGVLIALNPLYAVALLVAIGAVYLAGRSIVYPVALGGVPSLLIGLYGSNPLPGKVVFASLTAWLFLGLGVAFLSGVWPTAPAIRRVIMPPVFLIGALTFILIARLGPGAYPRTKLELFLTECLPMLFAGIMIGLRAKSFRLYFLIAFSLAALNAILLAYRLNVNDATQVYSARYSISTSFNPIWAGRSAAVGVLIALVLILAPRSRLRSVLGYVALPLLSAALLASGSRGPVVGLLAALIVLVALIVRDRRLRGRLGRIGIGVLAAGGAAAVIVPAAAVNRSASFLFGDASGLSSNGRSQLWSEAWRLFVQHFWSGIGTGGFANYAPDPVRYPHNIVLESAAELGVLGVSIVLVFLFLALRTAFGAWRLAPTHEERIAAALIASIVVATVVNAMLSDAIETTDALCLVVGLAYGLRARFVHEGRVPAASATTLRTGT